MRLRADSYAIGRLRRASRGTHRHTNPTDGGSTDRYASSANVDAGTANTNAKSYTQRRLSHAPDLQFPTRNGMSSETVSKRNEGSHC